MNLIILCIVFLCCFRPINCVSKSRHNRAAKKMPPWSYRNNPCPDANIIFPCSCSFNVEGNNVNMDCSIVINDEELPSAFRQKLPLYNFHTLIIHKNDDLTSLSSGIFGNSTFKFIDFNSVSKLSFIDSQIFEKMENTLTSIIFNYCHLTTFIYDFSSFSILNTLDFDFNSISSFNVSSPTVTSLRLHSNQLGRSKFDADLPNLETLTLDDNNFEQIPNLSQYTKLKYLSLTSNLIKEVKSGSICHSDSLRDVYLDSNEITHVGVDSICVKDGSYVYMYNNSLTRLPKEVFKPILESVFSGGLRIKGNPFDCGCDVDWLIGNSTYLNQIRFDASCLYGRRFRDLDPKDYELCQGLGYVP